MGGPGHKATAGCYLREEALAEARPLFAIHLLSGFRIQGSRFRVSGLGFRVEVLDFRS